MDGIASLAVGAIATILVVWLLGWLLAVALPRVGMRIGSLLDRGERYLPLSMRPIEHTLAATALVALTVLIMVSPSQAPWAVLTAPAASSAVTTVGLLGAAAALLALILFAATQTRGLEKDAGSGHTYLGENVDTYGARRSRAVRLLSRPVFHCAIVLLFAIPLIREWLPASTSIASVDMEPRRLALSIWCSCFAVVGGVLIANALGALRNSAVSVLVPDRVKTLIERDVEREAGEAFAAFLAPASQSGAHDARRWTEGCLRDVREIAEVDRARFLGMTLMPARYRDLRYRAHRAARAAVDRAARADASGSWIGGWRERRAARVLRRHADVATSRLRAMLEELRAPSTTPDVRRWLVQASLDEAAAADSDTLDLLRAMGDDPGASHDPDGIRATLHDVLRRPENLLPSLDAARPIRAWDADPGPEVEPIPALVFRALAEFVSPSWRTPRPIGLDRATLETIVATADALRDQRTREFSLRGVVSAVIRSVLVDRHEEEAVDAGVLTAWADRRAARAGQVARGPGSPASLPDIVQEAALELLVSQTTLAPDARGALLGLVTGWRAPAVLLYLLFYRHRENRPLSAADLRPFADAVARVHDDLSEKSDAMRDDAVPLLTRGSIGHIVDEDAVAWMYDSLREPLSPDLCAEFLDRRSHGRIREIDLPQFLQWHLICRPVGYGSPMFGAVGGDLLADGERHLPQLRRFAEGWEDVDHQATQALESFLSRFPAPPAEAPVVMYRGFV